MKVLQGQTIFDVALENFASLDYLCNIIRDNNVGLNYNISGRELVVNSSGLGNEIDKRYMKRFRCKNEYDQSGLFFITGDGKYFITGDGQKIIV